MLTTTFIIRRYINSPYIINNYIDSLYNKDFNINKQLKSYKTDLALIRKLD